MRRRHDDSGDDFDHDTNQQTRGIGGRQGRIILLGDGTEVLTDSDDQEMFDHDEEDKDLDAQVSKNHSHTESESDKGQPTSHTPEAMDSSNPFDSPSSNTTEKSTTQGDPPPYGNAAGDSDLPSKLMNPPSEKV